MDTEWFIGTALPYKDAEKIEGALARCVRAEEALRSAMSAISDGLAAVPEENK